MCDGKLSQYAVVYPYHRIQAFDGAAAEEDNHHEGIPQAYDRLVPVQSIPYYPIPKDTNAELYAKYSEAAKNYPGLRLVGRLAEYRYYDMNNIIERALDVFETEFKGDV